MIDPFIEFFGGVFHSSDDSSLPVAPKIDFKSMKPIKVKAGQKLKIKVPIKGAPPPEVGWAKGGVVLKPSPKKRPPTKEEEAEMIKLKGFTKSKFYTDV